jgi:glycerol-3-phosphate acyltransferase PlsY
MRPRRLAPVPVVTLSYLAGSVPIANIAARAHSGIDLRSYGNGTVSGTALYEVTGFGPLAAVGCVELAKGMVGPLLAGPKRPALAAVAAAAAITGHNWSPFLKLSGGRGLSLALGATAVTAPEGTVLLGAGLGFGRLSGQTGLGSFISIGLLPPLLWWRRGWRGLLLGVALAIPLVGKRMVGNAPRSGGDWSTYLRGLLYDKEEARLGSGPGGGQSLLAHQDHGESLVGGGDGGGQRVLGRERRRPRLLLRGSGHDGSLWRPKRRRAPVG